MKKKIALNPTSRKSLKQINDELFKLTRSNDNSPREKAAIQRLVKMLEDYE